MNAARGLLVVALVAFPFGVRASLLGDLSAEDQARVKAGGQVVLTEDLDGYPWPRVRVYQSVAASPREVMATFIDYNNACHYIPNCTKSRVSKEIAPGTSEVDYVVDVPILADEAYTARNELSGDPAGKLTVNWTVLRATSILESNGSLAVEPMGGGAVLRYTNLLKPSSRAAFLLKGMAMGQMKDTVQALVAEVRKKKGGSEMTAELARLDVALGKKGISAAPLSRTP